MLPEADKEKLDRYINDSSDQEEKEFVYEQFSEKEDDPDLKDHIHYDWDLSVKESTPESTELAFLLDRIHHIISLKESPKEPSVIYRVYHWYAQFAALLLIPILAFGAFLLWNSGVKEPLTTEGQASSTLFAPMGSRIEFTLPDGTKGWLNSGSSLGYTLPFSNNRKLNLKGEAFFDVTPSADFPFEITSGESKIKVMGTKFNVSAYPAEKYIEVVLEEGKVEFNHPDKSTKIVMKPSERLVFESGNLSRSMIDPSKYTAWIEGKLVFRGDPMAEVARRIERWYNVEVKLVDNEIDRYVFRGTFQDVSLEEVMRMLCMTSPLRYEIIECKLMDDGTYQKGKVLLYAKESKK